MLCVFKNQNKNPDPLFLGLRSMEIGKCLKHYNSCNSYAIAYWAWDCPQCELWSANGGLPQYAIIDSSFPYDQLAPHVVSFRFAWPVCILYVLSNAGFVHGYWDAIQISVKVGPNVWDKEINWLSRSLFGDYVLDTFIRFYSPLRMVYRTCALVEWCSDPCRFKRWRRWYCNKKMFKHTKFNVKQFVGETESIFCNYLVFRLHKLIVDSTSSCFT